MKFLVEYEIVDKAMPSEIQESRKEFSSQLERIETSKKVIDSGLFVGVKGSGYFIIEVDSAAELHGLLSPTIVDRCHVSVKAVMSLEDLRQLFKSQ